MARVDLRAIWLNDAADPADRIALVNVRLNRKAPAVEGRVVRGAGGLRRVIKRAGRDNSWSLVFGTTSPAEKEWLAAHVGRTVCVRDSRGAKMFGVYFSSPWEEYHFSANAQSVQVDVVEVSFSEAV